MEDRIAALEMRMTAVETYMAVRKERDIHLDRRFDRIEAMVKETQNTQYRVGWIVITFVITGVLAVALGGTILGL